MKILVIGTGYVGLTHGTCLADLGNEIICIDIDEKKIENLKQGIIPIYEPGLEELVIKNYKNERLQFSTDLEKNLNQVEIVFIAVGTPSDKDGHANLEYVKQVAKNIGKNIKKYLVIVTKSTVPVGTGDMIKGIIEKELEVRGKKYEFEMISNPEFLKEGTAVEDFKYGDRIVIGCKNEDGQAVQLLKKLYSPLKDTTILVTDLYSAELIKYGANALLAVEISFINAISQLCEKLGADVTKVSKGLKLDSRIGNKAFLNAGPGFGGSCFPKDVMEFAQTFRDYNIANGILDSTLQINEDQKKSIFEKVKNTLGGNIKGKTISILGLAFKSNTDDIRYSASLILVDLLKQYDATIKVYDPKAMENFKKFHSDLEYCNDFYDCIISSNCIVLMTDRDDFKQPDWNKVSSLVKQKNIIDTRNIYSERELKNLGWKYIGIGRK